jgi:hypothetical protein
MFDHVGCLTQVDRGTCCALGSAPRWGSSDLAFVIRNRRWLAAFGLEASLRLERFDALLLAIVSSIAGQLILACDVLLFVKAFLTCYFRLLIFSP